jgi:hypothetical protein
MSIQRRLDELEEHRNEATGPNTVDAVGELLPAIRHNSDVKLSPRLRALVPTDSNSTDD